MKNITSSIASLSITAILTACGGGSGGGNNSIPTPIPTPNPIVQADIQTSVQALTYPTESEEFAFVSAYNDFRSKLGLGLLAQNTILDTAATNHLRYVLANDINNGGTVNMSAINPAYNRPNFHIEDKDKINFTGSQEIDRANFIDYGGNYVGESGAFGGGKGSITAFDSLVSTVYHRSGLMYQFPRDIGVVVGTDQSQTVIMEFGVKGKGQTNAIDYFGVYPADKQDGVPLHAGVENPNPFPDLSTSNADFPSKTSFPINVLIQESLKLKVINFTVTETGKTTPLDVRLLTQENDTNKYLAANTAFIVGKAPFKPNTLYIVAFSGMAGNTSVSKSWSFTTKN